MKQPKDKLKKPKESPEWEDKIYDLFTKWEEMDGSEIEVTDAGTANEVILIVKDLLSKQRAEMREKIKKAYEKGRDDFIDEMY